MYYRSVGSDVFRLIYIFIIICVVVMEEFFYFVRSFIVYDRNVNWFQSNNFDGALTVHNYDVK